MLKEIRPALVLVVLLAALTGLAYPLAMTGLAQVLFPDKAKGSLVSRNGMVIGSALIGQAFTSERYFHGRPSATTAADPADATKTVAAPYNASNSMGSNLGPTNPALAERVKADLAALQAENPGVPVPIDLVTTSGSGLDPDISVEAALFQVPRIAKARGLSPDMVRQVVERTAEDRTFGVIGEPRVNVLELNLALDRIGGQS
ncbi:K(+)-transporting ATPase subunit C [Aquabacter sp. L1I39]|uniref:K(+)-transporting ATPase subunit C n=1 Tax=Aquabacter sp. L1I39 TaxID=2820278 RepID=UPI001ADCC2C7|nr:K(+)-transporting ATPase subunit C [Aquabacter sp. L1I39]QTL05043.1 K(+)-transporting ATPase subunit C [Aquabacter sp. L1I39]